jgi:TldD protein
MRDLTSRALDTATTRGATYADVRIVRRLEESISVKSGRVEGVASGESEGFGVRVLVDGAWGFAASHSLDAAEIDRVAGEAVRIARASATALRRPVVLDDRPAAHGTFTTPVVEDPFAVPLEEKIGDLLEADEAMNRVSGIAYTESLYGAQRESKAFAASDGSYTEQTITHVGAGIEANAVDGDEMQRRSWPDNGGGWQGAGYEYVRSLDLFGHAEANAEEAVALLSAPQLAPGRRTIVLDPSQLYMQIHESCGHPSELDRVYGTEASYAGTSFLTTDRLDEGFRYGSDYITIVADATAAGGMGTFGWDDEGVAAQAVPLVKEGIFSGYLSSRETAPRIGRRSGGAMRADGWNRIPLIRMTNINLLPVHGMSLDDIVADTDDGIYLAQCRSWSIDDRRLNFQFATEVGYEIKGGKKGRLIKNPTYTGITYELWRSCDAVGDASSYRMLGTPNCGKGEPGQVGHIGHAVSGARFRDVQVGVLK